MWKRKLIGILCLILATTNCDGSPDRREVSRESELTKPKVAQQFPIIEFVDVRGVQGALV